MTGRRETSTILQNGILKGRVIKFKSARELAGRIESYQISSPIVNRRCQFVQRRQQYNSLWKQSMSRKWDRTLNDVIWNSSSVHKLLIFTNSGRGTSGIYPNRRQWRMGVVTRRNRANGLLPSQGIWTWSLFRDWRLTLGAVNWDKARDIMIDSWRKCVYLRRLRLFRHQCRRNPHWLQWDWHVSGWVPIFPWTSMTFEWTLWSCQIEPYKLPSPLISHPTPRISAIGTRIAVAVSPKRREIAWSIVVAPGPFIVLLVPWSLTVTLTTMCRVGFIR